MPDKHHKGFTLAELLISLAILGVIATFTIPKILTAQQNGRDAAVFKETVATLNAVLYQGIVEGALTPSTVASYYLSHVNAVKICNSNSSTQGCWNTAIQGVADNGQINEPGLILHNGAVVVGLDNCCGNGGMGFQPGEAAGNFVIDVNGLAGPNQLNQDQYLLYQCFGSVPCTTWMTGSPGRIAISAAAQAAYFQ